MTWSHVCIDFKPALGSRENVFQEQLPCGRMSIRQDVGFVLEPESAADASRPKPFGLSGFGFVELV